MSRQFFKSRKYRLIAFTAILFCAGAIVFGPMLLREYRLYRGRQCLEARDLSAALGWFRSAERLDPDHAEAHYFLARGYRLMGDSELFAIHLKRANRFGFPRERLQREELLAFAQKGELSRAEPYLHVMLKNHGGDGRAICEAYVGGYFVTYQFGKAIRLLDAWQADFPEDAQPHVFRGIFLAHGSNWEGAIEEYRKAHQLAPQRQDVVLRLAGALSRLHRYDEASRLYRKALQSEANDPDVLLGWGKCLLGMGKKDEAREVYRRVIDISPDRFEAKLAMGQLEQASGRTGEALKWLVPAVDQRPYDVEARYALAKAVQETGDEDAARKHFQFVADAEKGMIEAQRLLEKINAEPDNYELRFQLGKLLLLYDDPDDGAACLRTVLDQFPDHQGANRLLAEFYSKRGNHRLSEEHRGRLKRSEDPEPVPGRNDSLPKQDC